MAASIMGILNWFRQRSGRFTRFDDAYALTREALWNSLRQTIEAPHHEAKSIWLVVHFTDTFAKLQSVLDDGGVGYEVVTQAIDPDRLDASGLLSTESVKLVLADLIPDVADRQPQVFDLDQTLGMIVVERHPNIHQDLKVESFARSLPVRVEFGHYISLDDAVVELVISETSIKILKQLGMNEHELIASSMVTRRLNKMLHRRSLSNHSNHPADSALQWLELNSSTQEQEQSTTRGSGSVKKNRPDE